MEKFESLKLFIYLDHHLWVTSFSHFIVDKEISTSRESPNDVVSPNNSF